MKKLFDKQAKLDDIILANTIKNWGKEVTHRQLINERMLSEYVEVAEFIEEKDHDKKKAEFADKLHFLLSCGLALGIDETISKYDITLLYEQSVKSMYETAVLNYIVKFGKFCNASRTFKYWSLDRKPRNIEKHYFKCFLALFDIAKTMGYTVSDIRQAYSEKWNINISRQQNGY